MVEEFNLKNLKEKYSILQNKYDLPSFEEMNNEFQIEKIAEFETDLILKEARKYIIDKLFGYLRVLESIITPSNAPMFVFAMAKALGIEERQRVIELYKKISKLEVEIIRLDLEYSEQKEADAIKKYYLFWKELKKEFIEIMEIINKNWDNKVEENGKGYFG